MQAGDKSDGNDTECFHGNRQKSKGEVGEVESQGHNMVGTAH